MGSIKDALLSNGFTCVGLCPSCSGRAWDYRKDSVQCKVQTDGNNNEVVAKFSGYINGRFINGQVAVANTIETKLIELGLKQNNDGNNNTTA
jgi:hypothetical protein